MTDRPAGSPSPSDASSRADLLRRGGLAAAGGLVGAAVLTRAGGVSAQSASQEQQVLNLLLLVERTEEAFYREALSDARLTGEMQEFAQVALEHETEHVSALEDALGSAADEPPTFDFGDATQSPEGFARAAADLEDVAVAAYNGQAGNVGPDAFLVAARIVSVEARHAAWIRSIANRDPAPDAVDAPSTEEEVRQALERIGVTA
jgi:hypothetical protein